MFVSVDNCIDLNALRLRYVRFILLRSNTTDRRQLQKYEVSIRSLDESALLSLKIVVEEAVQEDIVSYEKFLYICSEEVSRETSEKVRETMFRSQSLHIL